MGFAPRPKRKVTQEVPAKPPLEERISPAGAAAALPTFAPRPRPNKPLAAESAASQPAIGANLPTFAPRPQPKRLRTAAATHTKGLPSAARPTDGAGPIDAAGPTDTEGPTDAAGPPNKAGPTDKSGLSATPTLMFGPRHRPKKTPESLPDSPVDLPIPPTILSPIAPAYNPPPAVMPTNPSPGPSAATLGAGELDLDWLAPQSVAVRRLETPLRPPLNKQELLAWIQEAEDELEDGLQLVEKAQKRVRLLYKWLKDDDIM